eukprot:SAG11_NODE_3274_length_2561_cov_1.398863_1_plen_173_part_00
MCVCHPPLTPSNPLGTFVSIAKSCCPSSVCARGLRADIIYLTSWRWPCAAYTGQMAVADQRAGGARARGRGRGRGRGLALNTRCGVCGFGTVGGCALCAVCQRACWAVLVARASLASASWMPVCPNKREQKREEREESICTPPRVRLLSHVTCATRCRWIVSFVLTDTTACA